MTKQTILIIYFTIVKLLLHELYTVVDVEIYNERTL